MTHAVEGDFAEFIAWHTELAQDYADAERWMQKCDEGMPGWFPFVRGEKPETN